MNYAFPVIERIDDIRKAVEGRSEFIIAEREYFYVVNYMVSMPESFVMTGPTDYYGALRRECRGIIFDKTGNLISRPYHKFFNLGEKEETQLYAVDLTGPHEILEKMDGSFVRPLIIDGEVILGTKMGLTDIGFAATAYLTVEQRRWLKLQVELGKTPILEYVGPSNCIVIRYAEHELILTAVRDNLTGEYEQNPVSPFKYVTSYGSISDYCRNVK